MEKLQFVTNYRVPIEKDISQTIHHKLRQRQRLQHVQVTQRRYTCRATATVTTGVVTIQDLCDLRLVEKALNWVNRIRKNSLLPLLHHLQNLMVHHGQRVRHPVQRAIGEVSGTN